MLGVSWKAGITNAEILHRMNKDTRTLDTIIAERLQYHGQVIRNEERISHTSEDSARKSHRKKKPMLKKDGFRHNKSEIASTYKFTGICSIDFQRSS